MTSILLGGDWAARRAVVCGVLMMGLASTAHAQINTTPIPSKLDPAVSSLDTAKGARTPTNTLMPIPSMPADAKSSVPVFNTSLPSHLPAAVAIPANRASADAALNALASQPDPLADSAGIPITGPAHAAGLLKTIARAANQATPDTLSARTQSSSSAIQSLCVGNYAIAITDRPMSAIERSQCAARAIKVLELVIGNAGLVLITNSANTWLQTLSADQLAALVRRDNPIRSWKDLDARFPDQPVRLYASHDDPVLAWARNRLVSGTTTPSPTRLDLTLSDDPRLVRQAVANDRNALAWLPLSAIGSVQGIRVVGTAASADSTTDASPLDRPLYAYIAASALTDGRYLRAAKALGAALQSSDAQATTDLRQTAATQTLLRTGIERLSLGKAGFISAGTDTAPALATMATRSYSE